MVEQLFKDILSTQSHSGSVERMTQLISDYASFFDADVKVVNNNIYVTKGKPLPNGYPCIVSHTDTVHAIVPDDHFKVGYDHDNRIIYGYNPVKRDFTGIGGDDKVGIYIALAAVRDFTSIKACFFRDEEIGCVGSGDADLTFFSDCMYILQCDRKGNKDFVNRISSTPISSKEFQDDVASIIKHYGYDFHDGGMTDVYKLTTRQVGISTANMSCGYYNPHSSDELISVDDVDNTLRMVYEILWTLDKRYEHKVESKVYTTKSYYYDYDDWYTPKLDTSYTKLDTIDTYSEYGGFLDWYKDIPTDEDMKQMTYDDFYCHALAVMFGYEYNGNGAYAVHSGSITKFVTLAKIDMKEIENEIDDQAIWEAMEFATYCEEQRDIMMESDEPKQDCKCYSCSTNITKDEQRWYDGVCEQCFRSHQVVY
jgi:tripeptide aminopeptidase